MSGSYFQVSTIGMTARDLLTRRGICGQVLAVVSQAVYLRTGDQILWLTSGGFRQRRALLCTFEPAALEPGMTWRVRDNLLEFESRAIFEWEEAKVWQPTPVLFAGAAARVDVGMRLERLQDAIARSRLETRNLGYNQSLARLLPLRRAPCSDNEPVAQGIDTLLRAAVGPVAAMARALQKNDLESAISAGRELVGLGPGLTPSGDDLLGAFLFTVRHVSAAQPGTIPRAQACVDEMLDWARERTNRISYAILCDHAEGHGVDALHDLVAAILSNAEYGRILALAKRLVSIGSCSGWDLLAGMMLGMGALERRKVQCPPFGG